MCLQGYELNKNVWSLYGVIGICYMISNNKLDKDFFFFFKGKNANYIINIYLSDISMWLSSCSRTVNSEKKKKKNALPCAVSSLEKLCK